MTVIELLKASGNGKMPKVKCFNPPSYAKSDLGQVTEIWQPSEHGGRAGCAVLFPGMHNSVLFIETTTEVRYNINQLALA